jgi:hypothetical protein
VPTHSDADRGLPTHGDAVAGRLPRRARWALAGSAVVVLLAAGTLTVTRSPTELGLRLAIPEWVLGLAAVAVAVLVARRRRRRVAAERASAAPEGTSEPGSPPSPEPTRDAVPTPLRHLLVRSGRTTTVVDVGQISRIEADGRYVRLVTPERTHLAQYTLAELEARLDPAEFARIHRSTIVNLRRVRRLRTDDYRDFDVLLDDGSVVRMSRTYRARLEAALQAPRAGPGL